MRDDVLHEGYRPVALPIGAEEAPPLSSLLLSTRLFNHSLISIIRLSFVCCGFEVSTDCLTYSDLTDLVVSFSFDKSALTYSVTV